MFLRNFLALFAILPFLFSANSALADTEVGGNITEDTTWTLAKSPYVVTSDVSVYENTTLTIEAGVLVQLGPNISINVAGKLIAIGEEDGRISFTAIDSENRWGCILFMDQAEPAIVDNDVYVSGSYLNYCVFSYASQSAIIFQQSAYISKCYFSDNTKSKPYAGQDLYFGGYSPGGYVYECIFQDDMAVGSFYSYPVLKKNIFLGERPILIRGYRPTISNNEIYADEIAIDWAYGKPEILNNNIHGKIAVGTYSSQRVNEGKIHYNNLYSTETTTYFLENFCGLNIDAANNWWGTTNLEEIDGLIYDHIDSIHLGTVNYLPIELGPVQGAGANIEIGGNLEGIITGSDSNAPIIDSKVTIDFGLYTHSDVNGYYSFDNLPQGIYALTVTANGYHTLMVEGVTISLEEVTNLNIVLDPKTTGTVSGQLVDAENLSPIQNAKVKLSNDNLSYNVNTDSDGNFSFVEVPPGDYNITTTDSSYWGATRNVTVSIDYNSEIDITAIPLHIIDQIQEGLYTQDQLDQAVANAEASKDLIIDQKDQNIFELNNTIDSMYTEDQLNQAVSDAENDYIFETFEEGQGGFSVDDKLYVQDGRLLFIGDQSSSDYHLRAWNGGNNPGGMHPQPTNSNYFTDFNLSVDVYYTGGSHYHGYGIYIFYKETEDLIYFVLSEDDIYIKITGNGVNEIEGWTTTPAARPEGERNTLSIIKNDTHLSFLLNGIEVYKSAAFPYTPDWHETFKGGSVGVICNYMVSADFDNFILHPLKTGIMYTQDQLTSQKEQITQEKNEEIQTLESTIAGMYTQAEFDQAVADAEAEKDQVINDLQSTIESMYTQQELDDAVSSEALKYDPDGDMAIGLENIIYYLQTLSGVRTNHADQ